MKLMRLAADDISCCHQLPVSQALKHIDKCGDQRSDPQNHSDMRQIIGKRPDVEYMLAKITIMPCQSQRDETTTLHALVARKSLDFLYLRSFEQAQEQVRDGAAVRKGARTAMKQMIKRA
jgi:hypothetical protein